MLTEDWKEIKIEFLYHFLKFDGLMETSCFACKDK